MIEGAGVSVGTDGRELVDGDGVGFNSIGETGIGAVSMGKDNMVGLLGKEIECGVSIEFCVGLGAGMIESELGWDSPIGTGHNSLDKHGLTAVLCEQV